jgi:hypothetical protein
MLFAYTYRCIVSNDQPSSAPSAMLPIRDRTVSPSLFSASI